MPEPPGYENEAALLRKLGCFLFADPMRSTPFPIEEVYQNLGEEELTVDHALKKLERSEMITLDLRGARVGLLGNGRAHYASNSIAEVALGKPYVAKKFGPAVVHIVVKDSCGNIAGGTGFVPDFPWHSIVTAAHVLKGRTLVSITYPDGTVITPNDCAGLLYGPDDIDLAVIRCQGLPAVDPIPIEWRKRTTAPLTELILFGYPRIAWIKPGLFHATAQLQQIGTNYSDRDSLIISSSQPGCSGGPIIDERGYVIGVVEQENIYHNEGLVSSYFCATPAHYLSEVMQ